MPCYCKKKSSYAHCFNGKPWKERERGAGAQSLLCKGLLTLGSVHFKRHHNWKLDDSLQVRRGQEGALESHSGDSSKDLDPLAIVSD